MNRRDFIKGASSTLLPGGLLKRLMGLGLGDQAENVAASASDFNENNAAEMLSMLGGEHADARYAKKLGMTPEVASGYIARLAATNPAKLVRFTTEMNPQQIDDYTGGALSRAMVALTGKLGPKAMLQYITDTANGDISEPELCCYINLQKMVPAINTLLGNSAQAALNNPEMLPQVTKKLQLSSEYADKHVQRTRKYSRQERVKAEKERRKPQPLEKIVPDEDDYIDHSSMHQPYESRKPTPAEIANLITEDVNFRAGMV